MFNESSHDKRKYVNLTDSEAAVLAAASRIFSAYITQDKVDENSENKFMALALKQAIKLAKNADDLIRSGKEM
jgi:hypothetical protein